MEYLTTLQQNGIKCPTAVTVGKFDGLHRGHELLMEKLLAKRAQGLAPTVVTFAVSPRLELGKDTVQSLITNEERRWILEQEEIAYLVELPFNKEIMQMSPEDFIRLLVEKAHMKYMTAGKDFHFGYQGKGDVNLLERLAQEFGFTLEIIDKIREDERDISSTFIREEILEGHVEKASSLLGYDYFLWGEVVHGNHLGGRLGIPTINMVPSPGKLLPKFGVYVTRVVIGKRIYAGVTNVGCKPTIDGSFQPGAETHILDFHGDIYHEMVKIVFLDFLRCEQKFDSLDALKRQMNADIGRARRYFGEN